MPHPDRRWLIKAAVGATAGLSLPGQSDAQRHDPPMIAPTPPMGWSSGRIFGVGLNEAQALESAQIMVEKLRASGYDLFTLDGPWWAQAGRLNLDGYGRPFPAADLFPSSIGGAGFKPMADSLHASFLRFGVQVKRGIPRLAVEQNLPILGTNLRARDIALTPPSGRAASTLPSDDMIGIDMHKDGAQAYYNSVLKLLADWGVDFVRIDDMTRPYGEHYLDIEAVRMAIEASGRPMILGLASGETDLKWAAHAEQNAQMWRISSGITDDWKTLKAQFTRLKDWSAYRSPGHWPEIDSLPLGQLDGARASGLTRDEQTTLMTLWAISRQPLFMGGDLRGLDQPTLDLLTNPEVLKVNQKSQRNRASYMKNDGDAYHYWTAVPEDGKGLYVALFNLADEERFRYINLWEVGLSGKASVRDLWEHKEMGPVTTRFGITLPAHASGLFLIS